MLCPRWGIPINGNYGGITCNSCGYSQSGMRRIANVCPYLSKLEEWWDVELLFGLIDK